jgi:hypothetical protein
VTWRSSVCSFSAATALYYPGCEGGGDGAQEGYPAKHQPEGHQASSGSDRVVIAATACGHRGNCPPDCGQAAFANGRVALGSFAVCCGWVIASRRFLARLMGWLAIASGAGLALSRISWTSYIWLLPYLMFWVWVITVAVLLLRRNFRGVARSG